MASDVRKTRTSAMHGKVAAANALMSHVRRHVASQKTDGDTACDNVLQLEHNIVYITLDKRHKNLDIAKSMEAEAHKLCLKLGITSLWEAHAAEQEVPSAQTSKSVHLGVFGSIVFVCLCEHTIQQSMSSLAEHAGSP